MYIRCILLNTFVRCDRERTAARDVRFILLFEHAIQIALLSTFAFHRTDKSLIDIPTRFYLQQFTNVIFDFCIPVRGIVSPFSFRKSFPSLELRRLTTARTTNRLIVF